jgi:hypothetical protein
MTKKAFLTLFLFMIGLAAMYAQSAKIPILVLEAEYIGKDPLYGYVASHIDQILTESLFSKESLTVKTQKQIDGKNPMSRLFTDAVFQDELRKTSKSDYVLRPVYNVENLQATIYFYVFEISGMRLKLFFENPAFAGIDLIGSLEDITQQTAQKIALQLPPLASEVIISAHVPPELKKKVTDNEKLLDRAMAKQYFVNVTPLTSFSLGRTIIAWSDGPLLSPALEIEGGLYLDDERTINVKGGLEYLPFDFFDQTEQTFELAGYVTVGYRVKGIFSFCYDAGLAVIFDSNTDCKALSYINGVVIEQPDAQRLSLSLPVFFTINYQLTDSFRLFLRLKYYGLTYTFESADPSSHEYGAGTMLYSHGFSPWNLMNISISIGGGADL